MHRENLDRALQVLGDPLVGLELTVAGELGASGAQSPACAWQTVMPMLMHPLAKLCANPCTDPT